MGGNTVFSLEDISLVWDGWMTCRYSLFDGGNNSLYSSTIQISPVEREKGIG